VKAVRRFLRGELAPPLLPACVLGIASARLLFELVLLPGRVTPGALLGGLAHTAAFYLAVASLFALVLRHTLALGEAEAGRAVCAGLLLGLLPPLLDSLSGSSTAGPYVYFRKLSLSLFSPGQAPAESLALWAAVCGCGVLGLVLGKGVVRSLAAAAAGYLTVLLCSVVSVLVQRSSFRPEAYLTQAWLAVALAAWLAGRFRHLAGTLPRLVHCLPHALLAACGAAWAGGGLAVMLRRGGLALFLLLLVLVHNDHYDSEFDRDRARAPTAHDAWLGHCFWAIVLLELAARAPLLAPAALLLLLVSLLYHHPAFRLKRTFCLSYKLEGAAGLLCLLLGALSGDGSAAGPGLLLPGLLVLGGASLLAVPKDFKDAEADAHAGVPTLHVLLARRGVAPARTQRGLSLAVLAALLLPPGLLAGAGAVNAWTAALVPLAVSCAGVLRGTAKPRRSLLLYLLLLSCYLALLAGAVWRWRGGR